MAHQAKRKRTSGKAIPYGSLEFVDYQERKRRERQRRGKVGMTIGSSYLTPVGERLKTALRRSRKR